jgi:Electron transfer DM13
MKRQTLLLVMLMNTFIANAVLLINSGMPSAHAESAKTAFQSMKKVNVLATGSFVRSEHPTKGDVQIVMQNGHKYLRLNKNFRSDSGPDLFVILHRQDSPKDYDRNNYVSLGRLKNVAGKQLYRIPDSVDVNEFKSVVIWCKQFNATFGFAVLS